MNVRQPKWSKTLYATSVAVGGALLVLIFASGPTPLVAVIFTVAVIGICTFNIATVASVATAAVHGPPRIRNRFATLALERADIEKVIVRTGLRSVNRVEFLLRDGSIIPLVASEMPPLPGTRRRLEVQATEVRPWLEAEVSR